MEPEGSLQDSQVRASFQALPIPFFILGISQLGHKTRPGHCNTKDLVVIGLVCVFLEVFLTALYFRATYCPTFRACTPLTQVPCVSECPWEGLGNIRHLHEWGTSSECGATILPVECITASFLTIFQIGENTQ